MDWDEPIGHDSPPFGDVTVTDGASLSIGTVPGEPGSAGIGRLLQSRTATDVTLMLPVPPGAALVTATPNSVPVLSVGPQSVPRTAASTVYDPPPLSMTWNTVPPAELRNVPSVMLPVPAHSARFPDSWIVTLNPSTGIVFSREIVTGKRTQVF